MGYYAKGDGKIKLNKALPEDFDANSYGVDVDIDNSSLQAWIYFTDKYWEDRVYNILEQFSPYTKEGYVNFTGEDGCVWRFIFKDGEWFEEGARIIYESEPALSINENKKQELIKQIINVFNDVISDGKPSEKYIEGATYNKLSNRLINALEQWRIL